MKIIPFEAKNFVDKKISYDIGRLHQLSQGVWEFCLSSVAISYVKNEDETVTQKSVNSVFVISSNFLQGQQVKNNLIVDEPYPLIHLHININPGERKLIRLQTRDYFEINTPSREFECNIRYQSSGNEIEEDIAKYLKVSFLVFLHRRA